MPKFKDPIVSDELIEDSLGNIVSKADYGEFNPMLQLRSFSDLEKGGTFIGVDYEIDVSQPIAKIALSYMNSLKPIDRESKSAELMKNGDLAESFFTTIYNSIA